MKIVSKLKDYYDHMAFLYAIDENLIFDRREMLAVRYPYDSIADDDVIKVSVAVCGLRYDGVASNGKFYWGDERSQFGVEITDKELKHNLHYKYFVESDSTKAIYIRNRNGTPYEVLVSPIPTKVNDLLRCPIVLLCNKNRDNYHSLLPRLMDIDFAKVMSPNKMWIELSNWFSQRLSATEVSDDNMSDKEKITSHGFDLKKSFRH